MITREEYNNTVRRALKYFERAGIVLNGEEKGRIEVVDFSFDDLEHMGIQILVYVNTQKVCAKEMVLFPRQTCAEHIHPTINGVPGKEETFRCRWGKVYLYVQGEPAGEIKAVMHENMKGNITAFKEIELNAGEQYTLYPDTLHWFQAGPDGAVISEFSTANTDETDRFTDARINRFTEVKE